MFGAVLGLLLFAGREYNALHGGWSGSHVVGDWNCPIVVATDPGEKSARGRQRRK
jgi:hypothetical protein